MKLRDVIKAVGNRLGWIEFHWNWQISKDNSIIPVMDVDLNLDSEVDVCYQWFWHCNPHIDTKEIWNSIKDHDYETFMKWYEKLKYEDLVYLPSNAAIMAGDYYVGDVCIAYMPETFALITSEDYECG